MTAVIKKSLNDETAFGVRCTRHGCCTVLRKLLGMTVVNTQFVRIIEVEHDGVKCV
jgi:hypothetical protein